MDRFQMVCETRTQLWIRRNSTVGLTLHGEINSQFETLTNYRFFSAIPFEEDGSFIGQYGTIRKQPSFPPTTLPSSAMVVPATAAANPGTFV